MDGGAWKAAVHGVAEGRTWLSDFTFTFHFHALEKEMATHSSVLAWRTPGTGEPGGLPSIGSHRVGHDWGDLAAAAAVFAEEERERERHFKGFSQWHLFYGPMKLRYENNSLVRSRCSDFIKGTNSAPFLSLFIPCEKQIGFVGLKRLIAKSFPIPESYNYCFSCFKWLLKYHIFYLWTHGQQSDFYTVIKKKNMNS